MNYIGVDIGSTYTKYCIVDADGKILELFAEQTPIRQREYFLEKLEWFRTRFSDLQLISCGYGRRNVAGQKAVNELTALAVGANVQCPEKTLLLDIGGQDTKVIFQEKGKLKGFFTNDKCAAGCGMFLKNVLEMLDARYEKVDLSNVSTATELVLSNVCAVFAQTEIVEAIAGNVPAEHIIQAVLRQIFTQAKALLNKVGTGPVALSGGLAEIKGLGPFAGQILDRQVFVPAHAQFLSAIGCAELCRQMAKEK